MNMSIFSDISAAAGRLNLSLNASEELSAKFNALATWHTAKAEQVVLQQNALADRLCILVEGTAQLLKQRRASSTLIATVQGQFVPLGTSGLNSPGRYMSEVRVAKGTTYISLDLAGLRDLFAIDPNFAAQFLRFVLTGASSLLWATRGLPSAPPADVALPDMGVAHGSDQDVARKLADAPFFSPLSTDRIIQLLTYADMELFSAGQTIACEGSPSTGVKILFSGRVTAAYTDARGGAPTQRMRTVIRPGVTLSWHNGQGGMVDPYTVTATRDTTMLIITKDNVQRLVEDAPMLAAILKRIEEPMSGSIRQPMT